MDSVRLVGRPAWHVDHDQRLGRTAAALLRFRTEKSRQAESAKAKGSYAKEVPARTAIAKTAGLLSSNREHQNR